MRLPSSRSLSTCLLVCLSAALTCHLRAQQTRFSTTHVNSERTLTQTVTAGTAALQARLAFDRRPISLILADVDSDGTPDLVTGYAVGSSGILLLQQGDPHAISPSETQPAEIAAGGAVAPFVSAANALDLPVRPDLLKTADLAGHGHSDLVLAAKGDTTAYLLFGDGAGHFASAQPLPLSGTITALATWRSPNGVTLVAAGVCAATGCSVQLLATDGSVQGTFATASAPTSIVVASLNNGSSLDLIVLTKDSAVVLDGASALSPAPRSASLALSAPTAAAVGLFAYDRRAFMQLAVLDAHGTLHVFARSGLDQTTPTLAEVAAHRRLAAQGKSPAGTSPVSFPWTEAETLPNVASAGPATMLRGRFSGGGYDDLVVLSGTQYTTVAHPVTATGNLRQTTPTVTIDSTSSAVTSAVATRLSPSAQMGLVTLTGNSAPLYTIPSSTRTLNVNTTADATPTTASQNLCKAGAAGCTLRSAIAVANADSAANGTNHVDTINLPAGTYVISATNGSTLDAYNSFNYHFNVDASVNFVGAGAGSTIINANHIDKAFTLNSGVINGFAPFDIFFSNLTIENGQDKNNPYTAPCNGGCDYFGGNMDWDSGGPGTLGLSNVLLTGGSMPNADVGGGGLFTSNVTTGATSPSGLTEIDNSTISNNSAPTQGGGLNITSIAPLTLNTVTLTGNSALPDSQNSAEAGYGGALWAEVNPNIGNSSGSTANTAINITNSTFTSNTAHDYGGAMALFQTSPTVTGTTFSSNSAGAFAGAVYINGSDVSVPTITTSTFIGNSVTGNTSDPVLANAPYPTNGAALCVDPNSTSAHPTQLLLQYSRIHGNTGGHSTGLGVGCTLPTNAASADAAVTATENWWGCNGPASGTGCDTASTAPYSHPAITLTLSPYTTLILNLSTTNVSIGSSLTATGSLGQDSAGTRYSQAQDAAYIGLPATISLSNVSSTSTSGSTLSPTANTAVSFAAITATGTTNAGGAGTASVTVDGTTVSQGFTVVSPDLTVASAHTGNFKAGDPADTYTLTATNIGNGPTSGTVTLTDTLPAGFTATALSGPGWTCTLASLTCTRADALAAGSSYGALTLTVSVSSSDAGTYTNTAQISGGNESNTGNDTATDTTLVVAPPTLAQAFNPTSIAPGATSTVTFTLGNPSANPVSLTGVNFTDTLPSGLTVASPNGASTTCSGGTVAATAGSSSIALSNASLAAGATCTVSVSVTSPTPGTYTNTSGPVAASNSNAGQTASATLTVTRATPSVTVSNPSILYGTASTTLTASVAYAGSAPTGGLTFTVDTGSTVAATCTGATSPLTCTATYPTSTLTAGTHTITATEAADTRYNTASGTGTLTVTKATPSITVNSTSVTQGTASTTLTGSVAYTGSAAPTGGLTFTVDAGSPVAATCTGANSPLTCTASYPTSTLTAGPHTITATEAADTNYTTASGTGTLTVTQASTDSVSVSNTSIVYATSSATLTASVAYTGTTAPTGGLSFTVENGPAVAATCTGSTSPLTCTATYPTSTLSVGSHTITATEAADTNYKTAAMGAGTLTVTKSTPSVTVSSTSIIQGTASTTLTASVAYTGPSAPTGGLTFTIENGPAVGATCSGSTSPLTCTATYPTSTLPVGPHTITAIEALDPTYNTASATGTLTVTQASTDSVSVSSTSISYGSTSTTLTASVTFTGPAAPTGGLTFTVDGGMSIAATCSGVTSPLTCTASYPANTLTAGTHTITAIEAADTNYKTAASSTATLTVTKATPSVTVSPTSITQGTAFTTLIAGVAYTGSSAPSGGLIFTVDTGSSTAATCSGSTSPLTCTASYPTATLTAGTHTITATEAADTNYNTASGTATLTVNAANGTAVVLTVSSAFSRQGDGSYIVTLTINNSGGSTAPNVVLTAVTVGAANGTPVPQSLGALAAGSSVTTSVSVPSSAGTTGARVVERVAGTYTGGTFGGTSRTTLP